MKAITVALSSETSPSVSMILPTKQRIKEHMTAKEEDSKMVKSLKTAVWLDFVSRFVLIWITLCMLYFSKPAKCLLE